MEKKSKLTKCKEKRSKNGEEKGREKYIGRGKRKFNESDKMQTQIQLKIKMAVI